jgi:hypothetical protein
MRRKRRKRPRRQCLMRNSVGQRRYWFPINKTDRPQTAVEERRRELFWGGEESGPCGKVNPLSTDPVGRVVEQGNEPKERREEKRRGKKRMLDGD